MIVYGQYSPEQIAGRFKLAGKEAAPLASMAIETLLPYKNMLHTITADNGKDFARHKEKLNHRPRKSLGYLTPLEYFK